MSLPGNPHGGLDKKRCIVLPTYPVVPDLEHPLCKPVQDFFVNFRYLDFAIPRAAVGLVWPVLDCLILGRDNVAGPLLSSQPARTNNITKDRCVSSILTCIKVGVTFPFLTVTRLINLWLFYLWCAWFAWALPCARFLLHCIVSYLSSVFEPVPTNYRLH